jgi:hypothetical protein
MIHTDGKPTIANMISAREREIKGRHMRDARLNRLEGSRVIGAAERITKEAAKK